MPGAGPVADPLTGAKSIWVEIRVCKNLLDSRSPSRRWLEITISKKSWSVRAFDRAIQDLDPVLQTLAGQIHKEVSEYLDRNCWPTPFDALSWLRRRLHGTFYIGRTEKER